MEEQRREQQRDLLQQQHHHHAACCAMTPELSELYHTIRTIDGCGWDMAIERLNLAIKEHVTSHVSGTGLGSGTALARGPEDSAPHEEYEEHGRIAIRGLADCSAKSMSRVGSPDANKIP